MELTQFKRINNLLGWLILLIGTATYVLTMESTASLWDCGEFIASVYKQLVVNPPGAPTFLMISRFFNVLALGDPELVALSVNFMSAFCSGLAGMFLFWIITHLSRRMLTQPGQLIATDQTIAIFAAGLVGSLAAVFSDSVWFSAVEAEVYSMSLFFTALIFWTMLKWEERADEPYADRWLLLITFLMGTAIFVHWLNLLTIPALTFIYYFRRHTPTRTGIILTFFVSIALLGFIYMPIITGMVSVAAAMEVGLVNNFGMPFNSGLILYVLLLVVSLAGSIYLTYKNQTLDRRTLILLGTLLFLLAAPVDSNILVIVFFLGLLSAGLYYIRNSSTAAVHNALMGLLFVLIGYSTIVTVVIRSNSEPIIDMNSPRDLVSLDAYLNREQYGRRPFLTGYDYTAKIVGANETSPKYRRVGEQYAIVGHQLEYEYEGKEMFFPRIYSSEGEHKALYEQWLGLREGEKPTYADNLQFFFNYQIGHMYLRYLLWNYAGRQNDEQGLGDSRDGNWISGIPFIDAIRLGPQANLPEHIRNIPARTTFFFIPFILGLLGMIFHFSNDRKRAWVVLMLWFFCGVAMIIQGNSPPIEPRERDYIFVGSFYAFCIWIGMGVIALYDLLRSAKLAPNMAATVAGVLSLIAPILMASEGWAMHNRNNRFAARDFAANYLNSCAPNALIFTQGDNDTYPLWYAQEVEGIRRDVRVVNLSLLGVDWYIDQLRRKANDAAPVPMTLKPEQYRGSKRDAVYYYENPNVVNPNSAADLRQIMAFIADDSKSSIPDQKDLNYFPTQNFLLPVDKAKVMATNALTPEAQAQMVDQLSWKMTRKNLYKNDLMVLDIIAANNWERPIYFAISVQASSYLGLEKYFQLEGLAYRLVPIENKQPARGGLYGTVNADIMYDNVMNKFRYGNLNDPNVYTDSDLRRMVYNFRSNFSRFAEEFIRRGQKDKALAVLNKAEEVFPDHVAAHNVFSFSLIDSFYKAGGNEQANKLAELVGKRVSDELRYIKALPRGLAGQYEQESQMNEYFLQTFSQRARELNQTDVAKKLEDWSKGL